MLERCTYRYVLLLVVLGSMSTACEEDVVAVLGTEHPFTMYGVFTPGPDTQWVRVFPVKGRLELTKPEPLDAIVTSTNLMTNDVHVWTDSITQDERGRYSHLFWSPFAVEYGHAYQLRAERSDGALSEVEVTVPVQTSLVLQDPHIATRRVSVPVLVEGAPNASLIRIEVTYATIYAPGPASSATLGILSVYDGKQRQTEDGWLFDINLSEDVEMIKEELSKSALWLPSFGVGLTSITLRLMVVDKAWNPPEGSFDPHVLVQPGTLSNVNNGFGFVGAGYRLEQTWRPDDETLRLAGFREEDDGNDPDPEEPDQ